MRPSPTGRRAALALAALAPRPARADPEEPPAGRPLRLIVAAPGATTADALARLLQPRLAARLGQPVLVDNRPGAAGALAAAQLAAAPADGNALLLDPASFALAPYLHRSLPFDYVRDFAPVGTVAEAPLLLAASAGTGIAELRGYLAQARITQDGMPYGSPGVGSAGHLAGALLGWRAGVALEHVPYRTPRQAARDLASGALPSAVLPLEAAMPAIQAGRARAVALTGATPRGGLPTVAQAGFPGFDVTNRLAVFCRAGTPEALLHRLEDALAAAAGEEELARQATALGAVMAPARADRLGAQLEEERAVVERLLRETGIRFG